MKYREMPQIDLLAKKEELERDLFALKNEQAVSKKLEKPHLLREKKKERARILTALRSLKSEK